MWGWELHVVTKMRAMVAEAKEEKPACILMLIRTALVEERRLRASPLNWVFLKRDHMVALLANVMIIITSIFLRTYYLTVLYKH